MHVTDAPTKTRKLVKSVYFVRQRLAQAHKSRDNAERKQIIQQFTADVEDANAAIRATRLAGTDWDVAALMLRAGTELSPMARSGPITRLATLACRLGVNGASLAPLAEHVAQRANDAADRAEDRLASNEDELRSVALLGLLHRTEAEGKDTTSIKREYHASTDAAARRRRAKGQKT